MIIRVATKDGESAKPLVAGLVRRFGGEGVSLQDGEVRVQLNGHSGQRAMAETFASVERWLQETGIASTDVWVDGRRYRMERPRSLFESSELGEERVDLLGRVVVDDPDPNPAVG
jgi:hypothetical protein